MSHPRLYRTIGTSIACVLALSLLGCDVSSGDGEESNKVNGSIHVPAGRAAADVRTVNGSITVDDGGTIEAAGTVNGSIKLGMHAAATSLSTVNGSIRLGDGAHSSAANSVNGDLTLSDGAEVSGRVANTNGKISVMGGHVGGGIETANGDISVTGASKVEGGIEVTENSNGFSLTKRVPTIIIGPGATVQGDLIFKREVRLMVSDHATIGNVTGASAIPYSGDTPPP